MSKPITVLQAVKKSFIVASRYPVGILALAAIVAIPTGLVREQATAYFQKLFSQTLPANGHIVDPQQAQILSFVLADIPALLLSCVLAALTLPAVIRIFLGDMDGKPVSLSTALSFAILKWKRVIRPYLLATLIIWLGSIIIIPGVLYTLFFAFVTPIATLDDSAKHPLTRSTRLTRGRRGDIFRTYMVFIPWWGWYSTFGPLFMMNKSLWVRLLAEVGDEIVGILIFMALFQFYLARMEEIRQMMLERENQMAGKT